VLLLLLFLTLLLFCRVTAQETKPAPAVIPPLNTLTVQPQSKADRPKTILLIIDAQNDFHPEGGLKGTCSHHKEGTLAVPGANEDSQRIKKMIEDHWEDIDEIFLTMDTHYVSEKFLLALLPSHVVAP
jgi:hypothetical protein